jgi:serine/threonine-protein kinase TTK/MPS1
MYGDEEEVRRLFRFLRSEHVGVDAAEFYLQLAQFELQTGHPEKCLAVLEAASKISALLGNEALKRALVEFKLMGTFRLDGLVEGELVKFVQPMTPMSGSAMKSFSASVNMTTPSIRDIQNSFSTASNPTLVSTVKMPSLSNPPALISNPLASISNPPALIPNPPPASMPSLLSSTVALPQLTPTLASQPTFPNYKMTPIMMEVEVGRRDSSDSKSTPSVPRISPEEAIASTVTTRIRRLGKLGPPKRAILPHSTPSPDSTVPQDVQMVDASRLASPARYSHIHSPSKSGRLLDMTMDKENMSLTTVSPTVAKTATDDNTTTLRSRAVKVNGRTYKVLQLIGRGGSSKVFKVISPDNTVLALKKVGLRNLDETTLAGYINEISLLRSLKDAPHIIKLIDHEVNRESGNLYMVMEYGEADLSRLIKESRTTGNGTVDINFIRHMWVQMLQAVRTVHAAKIVHCDLKPANFLLVGGTLKLIDFGISKAIMNDTTNIVRENQVGTVNYMSPEALQESSASERGRIKIGRASDVWSLGCILYEIVYGRPPFAQFTLIQRLHKILDTGYEIEYGPADQVLLDVIRGCLQRNTKRRLTLEELLVHPFLMPRPVMPSDSVIVSRKQITELMEKFARHIPQIDVIALADKIFAQWQRPDM